MSDFESIRPVDVAGLAQRGENERWSQELIGAASGSATCMVSYIVTPPGGGSPAGLHIHEVDQTFYILDGVMSIEVDGVIAVAPAGSLVVFPKGVPHRNWNESDASTTHLAINTPTPQPDRPFATSV